MSIELQPLGVTCNLKCTYCYQNPMRDAGNENLYGAYDLEAMLRAAEAEGVGAPDGRGGRTGFTIFGGEPLMIPKPDLRRIYSYAREKGVPLAIQTNATLIDDEHIALFREFGVSVGVSIDGPEELNDTRWNGNLESTREMTARSQAALERLLAEGIPTSLIVTLNRVNAAPDRLSRLIAWANDLIAKGLSYINLHTLEVDHQLVREHQTLTSQETVEALRAFDAHVTGAEIAPLAAFRRLLLGDDGRENCIWHACDPYTTNAVRGIDGAGNRSNCGRTNKDGIAWVKTEAPGHERQLALYFTPQEHGGCAGCRFFAFCKGECPGTSESGDWRNRTEHCSTLMVMFEAAEASLAREGKQPLSLSIRRPLIEARLLEAWAAGRNMSIAAALTAPAGGTDRPHGDAPHGDVPHGDHTDSARPVVTHTDHQDARQLAGVKNGAVRPALAGDGGAGASRAA